VRKRWMAFLSLAALAGAGCASRSPEVFGRAVTLVPQDGREPKTKGELLAVDAQKVWVRTSEGVREVDNGSIREIRVKRHGYTGGWARRWGLIGGLVSGVALSVACSSVEGNGSSGCATIGLVSAGIWVSVGFLAAPGLEASSKVGLRPDERDRLRPYARFPAGLPKDVSPQSLAGGPPGPR
jgi:hypothetical protein